MHTDRTDHTTPAEPDTRTYRVELPATTVAPLTVVCEPDDLAIEIHAHLDPEGDADFRVDVAEDGRTARIVNDDGTDSGYGTLTITEVRPVADVEPAPVELTPEHTTPASLAAALRRAAADIEALGDIQLSATLLALSLQAVLWGGDEAERKATVDALARSLAGPDAPMETDETTHRLVHWWPRAGGNDMWFSIHTALDAEVNR